MSAEKPLGEIEFHRSGEWTGVYLNGELACYGDSYLADQWLQDRAGVGVIGSDDWIPDGRNPLGTLAEVKEETERRENLRSAAKKLREKAAELLRQANELER